MRRIEKIRLTIPTIDLLECKRFKGGYFELYDGQLDGAYCVADGPRNDYADADDGWEPDYDIANPGEYMDHLESQEADNENYADGIDQEPEANNVSWSVPGEMRNQIEQLLAKLPDLISNQNVEIVYNQGLLGLLDGGKGAAGTYLREGFILPDGTKVERDTILLGDNANMSTVHEELIHCWQENNCIAEGKTPGDVLSAMEFQAAVYMDLIGIVENQDFLVDNVMGDYYSDFLTNCFREGNVFTFDFEHFNYEYFIEHFGEFYEQWLDHYGSDHPYGKGDDQHYDWNWDELLNR
jgi:hypothetical protein